MIKRTIGILIFSIIMFLITGCDIIDKYTQPDAKEVLNKYLDASFKNRATEAYKYISSKDKAVKSLSMYKNDTYKEDNPFADIMLKSISFQVLDVKETNNTANAIVKITMPDMSIIFKDFMGAALSSAFTDNKSQSKLQEKIAKKYETEKLPTTSKKEKFHLIKEKDGWKVFLDWKTEELKNKKAELKRKKAEKISQLLLEAKQLRKDKKLSNAVSKYEEVLALNGEMVEAKEAIQETKKEINAIKEKQKYLKKIKLYDLKAKLYSSYLDGKIPGVEFKIKNNGSRTLKEVEVTIYFKNSKGTIIAEEKYYPVLVTEYSYSRNNKPLRPNYIWQQEKGHFYTADSVPSEWKVGSVSANITNIEFAD